MAAVSGMALLIVGGVTAADVIMRYLFLSPILAAADILQIAMPVVVFLALPFATRSDSHIAVDLFANLRNVRLNSIRDALIKLAVAAMSLALAWGGWERAEEAALFGEATNMIGLPFRPFFYVIVAGCAANAAALIAEAVCHVAFGIPPKSWLASTEPLQDDSVERP
ncbi:MAG: TRAP transporter small permease [Rhizobiaceae bacterium]|nr:TRAP transporter small permease [Rhizobiaceae bacterium]